MRKIILSVLVGLSATVSLAELAAIKDGLVYNLDASDVTTITTNELGNVVEWRAKEGMADMVFKGGTLEETDKLYYPWYETTRNSGLGAVRFGLTQDHTGNHSTWMVGAPKNGLVLTNRTVFLVWDILNDTQAYAQIWGKDGDETQAVWYSTNRRFEKKHFLSGTPSIDVSGTIWTPASGNSFFGSISSGRLYAVADTDRIYETAALGRARHSYANVETYYAKGEQTGSCTNNFYKGIISQILVYDRVLSDDEAAYMKDMLTRKWVTNAGKTILWTGAGDGVNWDDGANWKGGSVPGDGDVAEIGRNAVTVRSAVSCYDLETANASITVAAGATFAITNTLRATGSTLFTVKTGAELRVNKSEAFSSLAGEGASFVLDGGTLAKVGGGTFKFQHDGAVSGGVLRFDSGCIDLNGTSQDLLMFTTPSDTIYRSFVNSAEKPGTLRVATDSDLAALASGFVIQGNVNIARTGAGQVTFAHNVGPTGTVEFVGGRTVASADFDPAFLPGLVLHVDASRTDSLVTNDDGTVVGWYSLCGNDGARFYYPKPDPNNKFQKNIMQPKYQPDGLNGMPAIAFGVSAYPDLSSVWGWLQFTKSVKCKSFAVVHKTGAYDRGAVVLGTGGAAADALLYDYQYSSKYYDGHFVAGNDFVNVPTGAVLTVRGKVAYDETFPLMDGSDPRVTGQYDRQIPTCVVTVKPRKSAPTTFTPLLAHANSSYFSGWISEILVFDRALSVGERRNLEKYLMAKWNLTPLSVNDRYVDMLGTENTKYALSDGATVDLNGVTQTVAAVKSAGGAVTNGTLKIAEKLETVSAANGSLGTLTLEGDIDLTGVDFVLSGAKPRQGTVLRTTGHVTGPFKTVDAPDPTEVRYRTQRVIYGLPGILLLVR